MMYFISGEEITGRKCFSQELEVIKDHLDTFVGLIHCPLNYSSLNEMFGLIHCDLLLLMLPFLLLFYELSVFRKSSELSSATWTIFNPSPVPTLMSFLVSLSVSLSGYSFVLFFLAIGPSHTKAVCLSTTHLACSYRDISDSKVPS